ncbi:MAG: HPr family phosphocarrier protein [Candidatus Glassbacteria bacterium]|nr:HPr family phosphocarrier protein [Candidatus Glassbacteria bacterium]
MPQLRTEVTILNKLGLHARPAALLVQTTSKFKSDIYLKKNDMEVNAKSILGVMMLAAEQGTALMVSVAGEDAQEASRAVVELFKNKFDEDGEEQE